MTYTAYLERFRQTRKVQVTEASTETARAKIAALYPGWDISMFWYDWPQQQKEGK